LRQRNAPRAWHADAGDRHGGLIDRVVRVLCPDLGVEARRRKQGEG
jgi:hypothetical protein